MKTTRIVWPLFMVGLLAGCGGPSGVAVDEDAYGAGRGADTADGGAAASGAYEEGFEEGSAFDEGIAGPGGALENRVIYFAFDQSDVSQASRDLLASHGQYLAANPGTSVRLEGHADERGSREYNIGLGERRAQTVRQVLLLQGASAIQMSTVSYGEERPAAVGSDEESLSLNRRVELVYSR